MKSQITAGFCGWIGARRQSWALLSKIFSSLMADSYKLLVNCLEVQALGGRRYVSRSLLKAGISLN